MLVELARLSCSIEALGKVMWPFQRREMAWKAVVLQGGWHCTCLLHLCGVSETCYRYSAKLSEENEQIADLLVGLRCAKRSFGFGLCFFSTWAMFGALLEP